MSAADELVQACRKQDRKALSRLIEAIPKEKWSFLPDPKCATASLPPVTVQVWHLSGGSGINTYEKVSVCILQDELDQQLPPLFVDTFSDDELKIATYSSIPKEQRSATRN